MTARDVLARVVAAGALILSDAEGPYLDGVPADLVPLVQEHRVELRQLLAAERAGLNVYAATGTVTEFRVPWHSRTLFVVPTAADAGRLVVEHGVSRGRIWTAAELADVVGVAPDEKRAVALAKLAFDGDVVETRRR